MGPGQAGLAMSDDLIQRLEAFNERMSSRPAVANEGTFTATILAFSDEEASEAAKELYDLKYQIESEIGEYEATRRRP
jgi:hypothetical protein